MKRKVKRPDSKVIRVSYSVYAHLLKKANFGDTIDTILRRLLKLKNK